MSDISTPTVTDEQALEALEKAANDFGHKHIYKTSRARREDSPSCVYFDTDDGKPSCLIGRALHHLGVPDDVHEAADARVFIPLSPGRRSLNVTVSAAIGLSEALRQTGQFPKALAQ